MVPDLAGFMASPDTSGNADGGRNADGSGGGEPPGADDVVAGALASLGRGFTVVPDRSAPRAAERRIWFDTFDWRLFKAGLLLEYVPGRRGSELRLTEAETGNGTQAGAGNGSAGAANGTQARDGGRTGSAGAGNGAGTGTLTVPVTGWQASRPHPACDIPPGALADRVGKLIAPRALLPVTAVTQTTAVSRLLNTDDKTVARLVIERPVLPAGGDLAPRLRIQPVRGYPGQARRAARFLEETAGVTEAGGSVLEDALAALGREPGDYSNKVSAPVTAAMPASQAVAVILLYLLDALEANTDGVLRDIDPEFLHDFRVAVRRTRAAVKLFGPALITATRGGTAARKGTTARDRTAVRGVTAADIEQAAAEFKWLGDLTTPTRDLDVHLLGFDDLAAGLRAAKPDDLEPLRAYLKERRARELRVLARGLRSPRFRELTGHWRAVLTPISEGFTPIGERRGTARGTNVSKGLTPVSEAPPPAGRPVTPTGEKRGTRRGTKARSGERPAAVLAAGRTRRAFAKVVRRGTAITPDSPHESLHDLRKRCKELRYALEFFAPLHDRAAYAPVLADLKKLQDCLGDFQDSEVQIAEIRSLAIQMQAAGEAPAVTLLAMGEITAGLAENQAAARADFERRFTVFAGSEGQRRMSVLLDGAGA